MTTYYCFGTLIGKEDVRVIGPDFDFFLNADLIMCIIRLGMHGELEASLDRCREAGLCEHKLQSIRVVWYCFEEEAKELLK